jgi:hypothetical protein
MELFPQLTYFFEAIADDPKIGASHVSLYSSLLQQWNSLGGTNPFQIKRAIIMKKAKIASRHTYNKCMNDLHCYGYITYQPSCNSFTKSVVYLKCLEKEH